MTIYCPGVSSTGVLSKCCYGGLNCCLPFLRLTPNILVSEHNHLANFHISFNVVKSSHILRNNSLSHSMFLKGVVSAFPVHDVKMRGWE